MPRGVLSVPIPTCVGPEWPCPFPEAGKGAQGRRGRGAVGKATLEQRLRLLEEKFSGLEAKLQPVLLERRGRQPDNALTHADVALDVAESGGYQDKDAVQKSRSSEEYPPEVMARLCEVSLDKSTWDLILFMGNLETGVLASVVTGAFIALNLVVQLAFSVILVVKFNRRDSEAVDLATRWRETIGHAYLSSDNLGNSLVSRVCAEDLSLHISGQQLESLSTASAFAESIMGNMSVGSVICIGCVLAWCLSIVVEIKKNWQIIQAIWHVPRSRSTHFEVVGKQLKLQSIGLCKIGFVTLLAIVRLGVALMLAYSGSVWLSTTTEIEEIILNAVALNFVLEIDELIYKTMIPLRVAMRAQSLKPLVLPRARSWKGLDAGTALLILGTLASVAALGVGFVLPHLRDAKDIQAALCGGDRGFVLETHAPTGVVLGFHAPTSGQGPLGGAPKTLMQQVSSHLVHRHQYPKEHFEMNSWSDFVSARGMSLGEYTDAYGTCMDFGANDTHLSAALRSALKRPDVTSCGDLDWQDCSIDHPLTRLACPVTCNCSTPRSGVYHLEGCPLQHCAKTESYRRFKSHGRTADVQATVLRSMPEWIRYWMGYSDFMREHPEAKLQLDLEPPVVQDHFLKLGCGAVEEVRKAHPFRAKNSIRDFFCSEMDSKRRPLSAFCPHTCGCSEEGSEDKHFCPRRPLDGDSRSCDHLEFSVPGPPNCGGATYALFQCMPAEYNRQNLYRFTEKASGTTWEIRWETELDYGGALLGTAALPKWTLTGYGAGSSRSWHAFGQGGAALPQPTGWLLAGNASNASGPWGCPAVFAGVTPVSWKLDRSGVTCNSKVRALASSVEACAEACIHQAGADCSWFFWAVNGCFLPQPGCDLETDIDDENTRVIRRQTGLRPGMCHDFTGIYFTQSGTIARVRQAGCSLEVAIDGNATAGTFVLDSDNATAGTAHGGSIFIEGGLGNGTIGPGILDRDVNFTSGEYWKRVSFVLMDRSSAQGTSCQDWGQSPVMSLDLCITAIQELSGLEDLYEGYSPEHPQGLVLFHGRFYFNPHPDANPLSEDYMRFDTPIPICMSTEAN